MIKGGQSPGANGRLAALLGRERYLDAWRLENATKVLRLGSTHRDWKSASSFRLAQDDGTGKQHFCRGLK